MTTKLAFRLRELRILHSDARILFVLMLLLTASILGYMGIRIFGLSDIMTPLDFAALCFFAVACFALCNAQLHCLRRMRGDTRVRLERLTFVDELTGVYNFRYLTQRLDEELLRARRAGAPLAIIYIDIDNFKLVNDTLGHQAGNTVLQDIAQTIRMSLRGEDFVGRLGGDEFLVVLPQTDRLGASMAAERTTARLEAMDIAHVDGDHPGLITFSMGTACYPADGATQADLLRVADEAMYRVKRERRAASSAPAASQAVSAEIGVTS